MSINIKNREAQALVAELKAKTGQGATDLLLGLLRGEKARLDQDAGREIQEGFASARRLQEAWRALPVLDSRPPDEILSYDKDGLPT